MRQQWRKRISIILAMALVATNIYIVPSQAEGGESQALNRLIFQSEEGTQISSAEYGSTVKIRAEIGAAEVASGGAINIGSGSAVSTGSGSAVEVPSGGAVDVPSGENDEVDFYLGDSNGQLLDTVELVSGAAGSYAECLLTLSGENFKSVDTITVMAVLNDDVTNVNACKSAELKINKADISECTLEEIPPQEFADGAEIKPAVKVYDKQKNLLDSTNYEVSYSGNTAIGEASVRITGVGAYKGVLTGTFRIMGKKITVMPISGMWKYFGQNKIFTEEDYVISKDTEITGWKLGLASEEIGFTDYVLIGTVSDEDSFLAIDEKASKFEIREYKTTAVLEEDKTWYDSTDSQTINAPEGYFISGAKDADGNWNWGKSFETGALTEGVNTISYYLRSDKTDQTRKAIDQTEKKHKIYVDSVAPAVQGVALSGEITDTEAEVTALSNEGGMYYYIALPASVSTEVTADQIKQTVISGTGICGYGRISGGKALSFTVKKMVPLTEYRVYLYMEDAAENKSEVVASEVFTTEAISISGTLTIKGTPAVGNTLSTTISLDGADPGTVTYQWYRIRMEEDLESLNEVVDESHDAEQEDEDEEDEEDDEEEEDEEEEQSRKISLLAITEKDVDSSALPVANATKSTYAVTKADIGYRLIVEVKAENYSRSLSIMTDSFVPKLMPVYTMPQLASAVYNPTRTLASVAMPSGWSWIDKNIVPEVGITGYRAKYVPVDSAVYKTVIDTVKVPLTAKKLLRSMLKNLKGKAYTGSAIKNNFKLKDGKKTLSRKTEYTTTYKNNKAVGKATVKVKGKKNYKGSFSFTYKIKKKAIKNVTIQYNKNKAYTGKAAATKVVLKNGNNRLTKHKDYEISYHNNVKLGKAYFVLVGKGNYTGKKKVYYNIVPAKVKWRKVKKTKTAMRLRFKSNVENISYQVALSTNRNFTKKTTRTYVTGSQQFGMNGIAKKETYFVRVRAFKSAGKNPCYGAWSSVKKLKY